MNWVKLKKYCELSGDSANAVHNKRRSGLWMDGIYCKIAPDGNLWINTTEVDRWVETNSLAIPQNARQG